MSAARSSRRKAMPRCGGVFWRRWTEDSQPPTDKSFLALVAHESGPFCCVVNAADDGGHYFYISGTGEFLDAPNATHWAPAPPGPSVSRLEVPLG